LAADKEMIHAREPWPWWRWVVLGLISVALALSAYLSWHYLAGGSAIGCGGGSSCDEVLSSRWSSIGGVLPVSGLAAGAYLALLVASFSIGPATEMPVRRLAWRAMLILAGAAAGGAVWFIIVQKWIVGAFCPYCMATHITGLLLAVLIVWRAPKEFEKKSNVRVIGHLPAIGFTFGGLVLAGILAACQWTITSPSIYRAGEAQNNHLEIDSRAVPIVGSPEAHYVVTMLFDYKCPHCQQLHFMLGEVVRRYGGKLAFVLRPAPLNRECNPYIPRDVDEFKDSCDLAKIGLTVWAAKREAFPEFDQWMFSHESGDRWHPRSVEAARAKAIELVGQDKFETALADPWVDGYLQTSVRIYGDAGGGAIPKLVYGSHWVTPQSNDADDLISMLHDSLGVPEP
jgi:uncharacterized membrane protein/protein-disulfide isomerase